jgi:hypothetical protein
MSRSASCAAAVMFALLCACQSPPARPDAPSVGSNTNWLKPCDEDSECGAAAACLCGVCTRGCERDDQCAELGPAGLCAISAERGLAAACPDLPAAVGGMCMLGCVPGGCAEGMACLEGTCVPQQLPAAELCEPVHERSAGDRMREEQLLVQLLRARSDASCAAAGTPLHVDGRLTCAARVLADEMQQGKAFSLIDSLGRDSVRRMQLAGYSPELWGETYFVADDSAQSIPARGSGVNEACLALRDSRYRDIGVGSSGQVSIVTLGRE